MAQSPQLSLPVQASVDRARPPRLVGPPPFWRPRQAYFRWQWISDGKSIEVVVKGGTSGSNIPLWKSVVGELTKDPPRQNGADWNGVEWKNLGPAVLALLKKVPGSLRLFQLAPAIDTPVRDPNFPADYLLLGKVWSPARAYKVGDDISDGTNIEVVVSPGTSGAQPPQAWNSVGKNTIDGTVVWKNVGTVLTVLRNPAFDQDIRNPGTPAAEGCPVNFGQDPNDPASFSSQVDQGSAICSLLSGYAASTCFQALKIR